MAGPFLPQDISAAVRALIDGASRAPVRLPMLSGSMAPTLLPGDLLVVHPKKGRRLHIGDIAVFLSGGNLTAHRVLFACRFFYRSFMVEVGDANSAPRRLDERAVVGVATSVVRDGAELPLARGIVARRIAYRKLASLLLDLPLVRGLRRRLRGRERTHE